MNAEKRYRFQKAAALVICGVLVGCGCLIGQVKRAFALGNDAGSAYAVILEETRFGVEQAANLNAIAKRCGLEEDEAAVSLRKTMGDLARPDQLTEHMLAAFNQQLAVSAEALADKLGKLPELSQKDKSYVSNIRSELKSAFMRIENARYNEKAEAYNDARLWLRQRALYQ